MYVGTHELHAYELWTMRTYYFFSHQIICPLPYNIVILHKFHSLFLAINMSSESDDNSSDCSSPRPGHIQRYQFEPEVEQDDHFNPVDEERMVRLSFGLYCSSSML